MPPSKTKSVQYHSSIYSHPKFLFKWHKFNEPVQQETTPQRHLKVSWKQLDVQWRIQRGCFGCPGTNPRGTARQELGRSRSIARAVCSTVLHVYAVWSPKSPCVCHPHGLFVSTAKICLFNHVETKAAPRQDWLWINRFLFLCLTTKEARTGHPPDGRSGSAADVFNIISTGMQQSSLKHSISAFTTLFNR